MIEALGYEDDGLDDGVMLNKSADGSDDVQVLVRQPTHLPAMAEVSEMDEDEDELRQV